MRVLHPKADQVWGRDKHNPENERIKHQYFIFSKEAKRQNETTIDAVAKTLSRYGEYCKHRNFKKFHSRLFEAQGLKRAHWSNANPIRTIFKETFIQAGLPYFNPHSFRNTLVRL